MVNTQFTMPIVSLTLSSVFLGDESIRSRIFSYFPRKCIVCIEDADSVFATDLVRNGRLNVDTLLSGIDGPYVPRQIVYVLSCNDKTLLPTKLLRRFPHKLTFNLPIPENAHRILNLHFSNSTEFH